MSTRPTLAALLGGRSRGDVASFVAALYAARGAETRVDDGAAVVGGERHIVVPSGLRARLRHRLARPGTDADVVVAVDPARADALAARYDAPVRTPDDLDDLARYGLDRRVADAVYRDHLGVGLDGVAPPRSRRGAAAPADSPDARGGAHGRTESGRSTAVSAPMVVTVAVLAVAVLLTTAAAPVADLGGDAGGGVDTPASTDAPTSGATTDEAGSSAGTGAAAAPETPTPDWSAEVDEIWLAPGLTSRGITDADALAEAHSRTLANRSYTWELVYVERANGTERGRATETVSVATPSVYVSNVSWDGVLVSRGPITGSSYADGERRYQPTADGLDATAIDANESVGRQTSRAQRYYSTLLDGQETSLVRTWLEGTRLYVVRVEGARSPLVRNYSATAHVTPEGVVQYYSGSYCLVPLDGTSRGDACYSLTMRYSDVDETVVEPPSWYTEREPKSA